MPLHWGVGLIVLGLAACAPAAPPVATFPARPALLADLKWLGGRVDPVAALNQNVPEVLRRGSDAPGKAFSLALGRMAFRAPGLLGGMAAREGLTCQICHPGGRANSHFFIAGLSAQPGTVDTTTATFSQVLGDGVFNPIAIPSLEGVAASAPYGHDGRAATLDAFVHSVIEEEFAGRRPAPEIFAALMTYLLALAPAGTPAPKSRPVTLDQDLDAVLSDASVLDQALVLEKTEVSRFIIASLRHDLGRIAARFSIIQEEDGSARRRFASLSADLRTVRSLSVAGRFDEARAALDAWRRAMAAARPVLEAQEARSLYNPERLAESLAKTD